MELRVVVYERQVLPLFRGEPRLRHRRSSRLRWGLVAESFEEGREPISHFLEHAPSRVVVAMTRLGGHPTEQIVDLVLPTTQVALARRERHRQTRRGFGLFSDLCRANPSPDASITATLSFSGRSRRASRRSSCCRDVGSYDDAKKWIARPPEQVLDLELFIEGLAMLYQAAPGRGGKCASRWARSARPIEARLRRREGLELAARARASSQHLARLASCHTAPIACVPPTTLDQIRSYR